ncbi:hypothetical protein [Rhodococcoides fascians]|uniref:hypothetical protein n=1 Tax=Rhodococcoides fascians TaxID=1828 RepID=UPI00055EF7BC|nr:hypothetical protein [Rhodococcus fascians]
MPGVRRYLKQNIGREVVVQCWGFAVRGRLHAEKGDGIVLVDVSMLDQESRTPVWATMPGELMVPAPGVRFVQVVP